MFRPTLSCLLLPAFVLAFASVASAHGRSRAAMGPWSEGEIWDAAHEGLCEAGVTGCQVEVEHGANLGSVPSKISISGVRLHHHHWRADASRRSGAPSGLSRGLSRGSRVSITSPPFSAAPSLDLSLWFYPRRL